MSSVEGRKGGGGGGWGFLFPQESQVSMVGLWSTNNLDSRQVQEEDEEGTGGRGGGGGIDKGDEVGERRDEREH